ncbi:MAG TPA: hypothetical protein VF365_02740 [Candidatus Limnocylindria bacterium]
MDVHSYLDLGIVLALIGERQERLRRTSLSVRSRHERRVVRRWIGRQLVSLGHRLANEQPMRPAAAR